MLPSNTGRNRAQNGFTLIELIIVIVILGILAVTAAPRFIDMSSDANKAVLKSLGGAMKSAGNLVYAKSVIAGTHKLASSGVDLDGDGTNDVQTTYGYPSGSRTGGISEAMSDDFKTEYSWSTLYNQEVFYVGTEKAMGRSGAYVNQRPFLDKKCHLIYRSSTGVGAAPVITYETDGC